jgi:hypothetical protein
MVRLARSAVRTKCGYARGEGEGAGRGEGEVSFERVVREGDRQSSSYASLSFDASTGSRSASPYWEVASLRQKRAKEAY